MKAATIQFNGNEALNKALRRPPATQNTFSDQLNALRPIAGLQSGGELQPNGKLPLYSSDFLGGNSLFAAKPVQLNPLSTSVHPPAELHPLDEQDSVPGSKSQPTDPHARLVQQTEKWVAQTFYGAMLKQMRQSPFKSDLFNGGRAGDAYSSLFDQRLSERMAHGAGGKLVKSIVKNIERKLRKGGVASPSLEAKSPAVNEARISRDVPLL